MLLESSEIALPTNFTSLYYLDAVGAEPTCSSHLKLGVIENVWQMFVLVGFAVIKMRALQCIASDQILLWVIGSSCGMLVLS